MVSQYRLKEATHYAGLYTEACRERDSLKSDSFIFSAVPYGPQNGQKEMTRSSVAEGSQRATDRLLGL